MPKGNQEGSIEIHSGKLRMVYFVGGQRRRESTGMLPTKEGYKAAGAMLKRRLAEIEVGDYEMPAPPARDVTFSEFSKEWVTSLSNKKSREGKSYSPNSISRYNGTLRMWGKWMDDLKLRELTSESLDELTTKGLAGKAPNTKTMMMVVLKKFLRDAARANLTSMEVADKLRSPVYQRKRVEEIDVWTRDEVPLVEQYAREIDPMYGRMVEMNLRLGLRGGELRGLMVSDINWKTSELHVQRTASTTCDKTFPVKTELSNRRLKFAGRVAEIMREQSAIVGKSSPFLFPAPTDTKRPVPYYQWSLWAKFLSFKMGKTLSPHKLRHTFATTALTNGMTLHAVASYLGDTQVTVEKHYAAFVDRAARERAAAGFDAMYEAPIVPLTTQEVS